jgi:hypothetical protein
MPLSIDVFTLAAGELEEAEFAGWLREHLVALTAAYRSWSRQTAQNE